MQHRLWSHEVRLPAEAGSVARARVFVSRHLEDHGMPHLVGDLELVVSELATNALVHARSPFKVLLCAFTGIVTVEVSDASRVEPVLVAGPSLATSGRGVAIIQALSRDWGVLDRASGGKSVWAQFDSHDPCRARR